MKPTSCFVLLLSMLMLNSLIPIHAAENSVPATPGMAMLGINTLPLPDTKRRKRKVSKLESSAGALEYMTELRNRLSDSDGRPIFEHEDDPTSVWCMKDRDMVHSAYRPRPDSPSKCTLQNTFIFNWKSLAENEEKNTLPVQKGVLRAYLKPNPRLLKGDRPVSVDIEIRVGLTGDSESVQAGQVTVEVTRTTSWLEMDVTRGVQQLWPPVPYNHEVEFTLLLSVNCKDVKKVPAFFIDPTEIKLSKTKRRERYSSFQPLFLVFFNDELVKDLVRNGTNPVDPPLDGYSDLEGVHEQNNVEHVTREKRNSKSPCKVDSFSVNFHDLHLYYVSVPVAYNARQCTGSCSHYVLTEQDKLGTNHAKIMASAYAVSKHDPTVGFLHEPREPCCVPTRYSSMTLVVDIGGILKFIVYPAMRVETCGCR